MTSRNDKAGSAAMADAPVFSIMDAANAARLVAEEEPRPLIVDPGDAAPYPVEALGVLSSAAHAIKAHTQAPVAIAGQSVLCAVALAVQAHADVVLPTTNQPAPVSLFALTIAESGERKSAVDALALAPVRAREKELAVAQRAEMKQYRDDKAVYDAEREAASKLMKGTKKRTEGEADLRALNDPPEPPLIPMLTCPDPTFEGYVKLTAAGYPALGLFADEGGAFIGGHAMKQDERIKTAAALCGLWGGAPIKRVRASDDAFTLSGRRLSMHLMAQPKVAWCVLGDEILADQGLLSRLLVVYPASTMGIRLHQPPNADAKIALSAYCDRLAAILNTPQPLEEETKNELAPRPLGLAMSAAHLATAFANHVEVELRDGGAYQSIRGFANKAVEHACRIAAVLTLYRALEAREIDAEAMEGGITLTQHFLGELVRLRDVAAIPQHLNDAERLRLWMQSKWQGPVIYPTPIYKNGPLRSLRTKAAAVAALGVLEDHGWVWRIDGGAEIDGAWRQEAWGIYGSNGAT